MLQVHSLEKVSAGRSLLAIDTLEVQPGEVVVRTPVSQPYAPPLLSAVQWSDGTAEVVFSAVGRMAMTAIARVSLRTAMDPVALLPSTGYGALR